MFKFYFDFSMVTVDFCLVAGKISKEMEKRGGLFYSMVGCWLLVFTIVNKLTGLVRLDAESLNRFTLVQYLV